jgi:hypothetical protein
VIPAFVVCAVPARAAPTSSSGRRRRAEIAVALLLQSSDNVRHVGELRSHFRFDIVQLPREALTLRAAVWANRYGFSATQTRQLLQRGAQHRLDF